MATKKQTHKSKSGTKRTPNKTAASQRVIAAVGAESQRLVSAEVVEQTLGLKVGTLYRMARARLVPCYRRGVKKRGLLFNLQEVRTSLHQPAAMESPPMGDEAKG